jgi:UDP-4-amino-4,6-dideoxy-N-acetyl-beta-L-altrosamine N-acetyltransferase
MIIDREKLYTIDNYTYKNFVCLSEQDLMMVLEWRNNIGIRKWMTNIECITLENHLKFVDSLTRRDDLYYWLVYKNNIPIGVVDIFSINRDENSSETGYYLNPDFLDSGLGFEFFYYFKLFIHDSLYISITRGLMKYGNINSYMLITYFGGKIIGTKKMNKKKHFLMEINSKVFDTIKEGANDILKFAKFIRKNKVNFEKIINEKIA